MNHTTKLCLCILLSLSFFVASCQTSYPNLFLEFEGGAFGPDSHEGFGADSYEFDIAKLRPECSMSLKCRWELHWETALKCSWFSASAYNGYYNQFDKRTFSKNTYNIYCLGITSSFVLFTKCKFKIRPELNLLKCKRTLNEHFISYDGVTYDQKEILDYMKPKANEGLYLYGFALKFSYLLTPKFETTMTSYLQMFTLTDFGPVWGLTAGVSWNFY